MTDEFDALVRNSTWELVPRANHDVVGFKWVFRVKRKADGSVDRFKAWLVARGFLQEPGRDYFETFSPVVKPVTIRVILSVALSQGWSLLQLDVYHAFLNGTLFEEVYMVQLAGFVNREVPDYVCKLRKAIYSLKQTQRAWYLELSAFLISFGFRKSVADSSLFVYCAHGVTLYFLVYVDDIILTGNNDAFIGAFIQHLADRFSLKDFGPLHHFLGVEVVSTSSGLFLSQNQYVLDVLEHFGMTGAKAVSTPMCTSADLYAGDSPAFDATEYRRAIGRLQYLAITRPDVSFAVNRLAQFMASPTELHWQVVKWVLRYLKGTLHYGLHFCRGCPLSLLVYSDSDWGGIRDGGRSTTAYCVFFGSNIVSWKSAK